MDILKRLKKHEFIFKNVHESVFNLTLFGKACIAACQGSQENHR